MPIDYDALYAAEVGDPARLVMHRHRGVPPSAEMYPQTLWGDVFVQFVVTPLGSSDVAGLVTCYGWNERNQTAKLAVLSAPGSVGRAEALTMRGMLVFINYLFDVHPLRKLYGEVLEWNRHQFDSMLENGASLEGVLVDHELHGDTGVDLCIYAISRQAWSTFRSKSQTVDATLPPIEAVCVEAAVPDVNSLRLSELDSLQAVVVFALLEDRYGILVDDGEIDRLDDHGFRDWLESKDAEWRSQVHDAFDTSGSLSPL